MNGAFDCIQLTCWMTLCWRQHIRILHDYCLKDALEMDQWRTTFRKLANCSDNIINNEDVECWEFAAGWREHGVADARNLVISSKKLLMSTAHAGINRESGCRAHRLNLYLSETFTFWRKRSWSVVHLWVAAAASVTLVVRRTTKAGYSPSRDQPSKSNANAKLSTSYSSTCPAHTVTMTAEH